MRRNIPEKPCYGQVISEGPSMHMRPKGSATSLRATTEIGDVMTKMNEIPMCFKNKFIDLLNQHQAGE